MWILLIASLWWCLIVLCHHIWGLPLPNVEQTEVGSQEVADGNQSTTWQLSVRVCGSAGEPWVTSPTQSWVPQVRLSRGWGSAQRMNRACPVYASKVTSQIRPQFFPREGRVWGCFCWGSHHHLEWNIETREAVVPSALLLAKSFTLITIATLWSPSFPIPACRGGNWGLERWDDWSNVPLLRNGRARVTRGLLLHPHWEHQPDGGRCAPLDRTPL